VLQATVCDGLSFDSVSLCQDGGPASEVEVGWCEIIDALVVAVVVVIVDEGLDLGFEIAGQKVVLQQDKAVCLMPLGSRSTAPCGYTEIPSVLRDPNA
jgi:hypothetical protein